METTEPSKAPTLKIPPAQFVLIEHPAIIKSIPRGIASLGGPKELQRVVTELQSNSDCPDRDDAKIRLKLRPQDRWATAVWGTPVRTTDLLLKVTGPRRRRRRRRRVKFEDGTEGWENGEWEEVVTEEPGVVWKKVLEGDKKYKVEIVGQITHAVRFREMTDFQHSTYGSSFLPKVEETLLSDDYNKIISFDLSKDAGMAGGDELIRPPQFTLIQMPYVYSYLQNPSVKKALVDGQAMVLNTQIIPKIYTELLPYNAEKIPTGPPADMPAESTLEFAAKECVQLLHEAFAKRPMWSRRALVNHLPDHIIPHVRFCVAYVGYMWRGGPWRDTVCRYGINPREDPEMRKYQVVFFQIEDTKTIGYTAVADRKDKELVFRERKRTHIFDGKAIDALDGRCYQLCDVTDTLLCSLINRRKIRRKCDEKDGWYCAATMWKIKAIMRRKFRALIAEPTDEASAQAISKKDQEDYKRILEMESEEDEEGNFSGKIMSLAGDSRVKKRWQRIAERVGYGAGAETGVDVDEVELERWRREKAEKAEKEGDKEGAKEVEEDDEGEDDEEVQVVEGDIVGESEWRAENTEQRIKQLMQQMPGMGEDADMDDADDFELLGDDDDEDE